MGTFAAGLVLVPATSVEATQNPTTGQPGTTAGFNCATSTAPVEPGQAATAPGSAFNETTPGSHESEVLIPPSTFRCRPSVVKLKLDLHEIYNRGDDIDRALRAIVDEAIEKKAPLVEIIPGKGSGQLKKRVLRFLDQKEIKALYDRVEKDSHNFGRVFVHFRPK